MIKILVVAFIVTVVVPTVGGTIWSKISERNRVLKMKKSNKSLDPLAGNPKVVSRRSHIVTAQKSIKLPDEVQTIILKREIFY